MKIIEAKTITHLEIIEGDVIQDAQVVKYEDRPYIKRDILWDGAMILFTIAAILVSTVLIVIADGLSNEAKKIVCTDCTPGFVITNVTICYNGTSQYEASCKEILTDPKRSQAIATLFFGVMMLIISGIALCFKIQNLCN
jgi:Mn2+/Fe2+ NRAMP family transporter